MEKLPVKYSNLLSPFANRDKEQFIINVNSESGIFFSEKTFFQFITYRDREKYSFCQIYMILTQFEWENTFKK